MVRQGGYLVGINPTGVLGINLQSIQENSPPSFQRGPVPLRPTLSRGLRFSAAVIYPIATASTTFFSIYFPPVTPLGYITDCLGEGYLERSTALMARPCNGYRSAALGSLIDLEASDQDLSP